MTQGTPYTKADEDAVVDELTCQNCHRRTSEVTDGRCRLCRALAQVPGARDPVPEVMEGLRGKYGPPP
jgi:hypothetical protein